MKNWFEPIDTVEYGDIVCRFAGNTIYDLYLVAAVNDKQMFIIPCVCGDQPRLTSIDCTYKKLTHDNPLIEVLTEYYIKNPDRMEEVDSLAQRCRNC